MNERLLRYEFQRGTASDEARVVVITALGNILEVSEEE